MGNVLAAEPPKMPSPPLVPPPPTSPPDGGPPAPTPGQEGVSEDTGPGTFEDLHKKCKGNNTKMWNLVVISVCWCAVRTCEGAVSHAVPDPVVWLSYTDVTVSVIVRDSLSL